MTALIIVDLALTVYLVVLVRQLVARQATIADAFDRKLKMRVQTKLERR